MKKLFKKSVLVGSNGEQGISQMKQLDLKPEQQVQLSDEQRNYVENGSQRDTILIAVAGSGKTRCIIERMRYLAIRGLATKKQMMVFSFSKLTIQHMKFTTAQYADHEIFADQKLIKTIDSFCYDMIERLINKPGKSSSDDASLAKPSGDESGDDLEQVDNCAIQVLSSRFLEYINSKGEIIGKLLRKSRYRSIRHLFVDEAQDLNKTQYDILCFLKKALGCSIHMIGDPNQNIYQFRESYESYMLNHPADKFLLTRNFRSHPSIELFARYFQYYRESLVGDIPFDIVAPVVDEQGRQRTYREYKPNVNVHIHVDQQRANDTYLIQLIQQLVQKGVKYGNIAVLSPTIGEQFNTGIKRIANLLDNSYIPYIAQYTECKDASSVSVKGRSKRNGINLLTIHGSKGLEFPVVILVKFADTMMATESYDRHDYVAQNMNLIYVALTRAKQHLYVIHDESYNKHICSLMLQVPVSLYNATHDMSGQFEQITHKVEQRRALVDENAGFLANHQVNDRKDILLVSKYLLPELFALNQKEVLFTNSVFSWKTSVTRFIQSIKQPDLIQLMDQVKYKKKHIELYPITLEERKLFEHIRKDREILIGLLFEHLFYYQIKWIQSQQNAPIEQRSGNAKTPQIFKLTFNFKDYVNGLKFNHYFQFENSEQLLKFTSFYKELQRKSMVQPDIDRHLDALNNNVLDERVYHEIQESRQNGNLVRCIDFGNICANQIDILEKNAQQIFEAIREYNQGLHYTQSLQAITYITCIDYAIKTRHHKHVAFQQDLLNQLSQFAPIYAKLESVARDIVKQTVFYQYEVDNGDLHGFIDFLLHDGESLETSILEFKVTNDLSFEHILQLILYAFLLDQQKQTTVDPRLIIINALKGVMYEIELEQKENIFNMIAQILDQDQKQRFNSVSF